MVTPHVNIQAYMDNAVNVGDMVLVKVDQNGRYVSRQHFPSQSIESCISMLGEASILLRFINELLKMIKKKHIRLIFLTPPSSFLYLESLPDV